MLQSSAQVKQTNTRRSPIRSSQTKTNARQDLARALARKLSNVGKILMPRGGQTFPLPKKNDAAVSKCTLGRAGRRAQT